MSSIKYPAEFQALNEAIRVAGGQTALARAISTDEQPIRQGHVSNWLRDQRCGAQYVLKVEKASGVSRHLLRPDIYPNEENVSAASA